jgi:hypothetical protein
MNILKGLQQEYEEEMQKQGQAVTSLTGKAVS